MIENIMSESLENICHDEKTNSTPAWLNHDFFLKVLKNFENTTNVELINLKITTPSDKGDHYASVIFKAVVDYKLQNELKKKSMIIKAMTEVEGDQKEFFKDSKVFETEIAMYSTVIPKFEAMLKAIGDETKLGPSCLYYALTPRKVIIFEDLAELGYVSMNDRGTNFEETKSIYSKIAKWHALSFKLNTEQPELFEPFVHDTISPLKVKENPAFNDGIVNFIELLDSQPDLIQYKAYFSTQVDKLLSYWENTCLEYLKNRQPKGLYVLSHGDFHHRNVMFKYHPQSKRFENALLIDFQMCCMGSMANDVINSIYMIMDEEQRLKNLDELFYFYFETFKNTLIKIGFTGKIPKMLEFRQEMMRFKGFEMYLLTGFLPMMMAIDKGKYNISQLMTDAEIRKNVYKDPDYIEHVRQLLPKYLYMGYLED